MTLTTMTVKVLLDRVGLTAPTTQVQTKVQTGGSNGLPAPNSPSSCK